jgi:predicted ATPase
MKIFYTKKYSEQKELYNKDKNVVILSRDNWNDFGYEQSFSASIIRENELIAQQSIKILFLNQDDNQSASLYLESLMQENTIIDFEELNEIFISINSFYDEMVTYFGSDNNYTEIFEFSKLIKDLLYQEYLLHENNEFLIEENDFNLLKEKGQFSVSLLREQTIKRSRENGLINSLNGKEYKIEDCNFKFYYKLDNSEYDLSFNFYNRVLANPINVIIGKNGVGKTKSLEILVNYLLNPDRNKNLLIKKYNIECNHPNFISNLVVFSYNFFEKIPTKTNNMSIEYNYFGPKRLKTKSDEISIEILDDITSNEEFQLLKFILKDGIVSKNEDDALIELQKKFNAIDVNTIKNVLRNSNYFKKEYVIDITNYQKLTKDSFLRMCEKDKEKSIYGDANKLILFYINLKKHVKFVHRIGIKILSDNTIIVIEKYTDIYDNRLNEMTETEIVFLNEENKEIEHLSSGQKTFIQFFINIFSMIKPNSLIILDEPENTLHPTFEVEFMEILQKMLNIFNSFAIIATHSATITREVPSHNVQIIIRDEETNEVEIQQPVINTFGASISSINNYVFDDLFTEKRELEKWLLDEIKFYEKYESFEEKYIDFISSELMQKAFNYYKRNNHV